MWVAILDDNGTILRGEKISAKGLDDGYRPDGNWVPAQEGWEEGGTVIGGVYTPPVKPTDDEIDLAELNRILVSEGSVLRAIMELMLIEINKLRADHSRPPYTKAQFITALKAQMRTP